MYLYQYLRIFSFDIHTNPAASETEKKKSEETCRDLLLSLLVSLRSTAHTSACLTLHATRPNARYLHAGGRSCECPKAGLTRNGVSKFACRKLLSLSV